MKVEKSNIKKVKKEKPSLSKKIRDFSTLLIMSLALLYLFFPQKLVIAISIKAKENILKKTKMLNWALDARSYPNISIQKTWEITKGSKEIIVAVIDTGIDPNHPDLKDNLWRKKVKNSYEYGWDFTHNKANPKDKHGHGTHVAGIIGGKNRKTGVSGVALKVSIMPIRYYSAKSSGIENLSNTVKAINYAIDNGAHIINYSGGGAEFHLQEYKAVERANKHNILFVAAAGNERSNVDDEKNKYYPGAYPLPNIISVAATDIQDKLIPSSNWGLNSVDIAAPGEDIFSTLPNGKYGYLSGTSQATAFVSGLAALLLSENRLLTPVEIKNIILKNADKVITLKGKIRSGARLNAYKSILASINNKISPSYLYASITPSSKAASYNPFLRHPDFYLFLSKSKPIYLDRKISHN